MSQHRKIAVLTITMAVVTGACSGNKNAATTSTASDRSALITDVASYDLAAGTPLRVLVGLQTRDQLVSYGRARLSFTRVGQAVAASTPSVDAVWLPVPGQKLLEPRPDKPQLGGASDGIGLYAATVSFDQPGSWKVTARVDIAGTTRSGSTVFSVADKPIEVSVGETAPATVNRLPGSQPPAAVDSRATGGSVPDPELHRMTIADAITNGRPTMVVVSTPTYCISRFCGPITDTVASLARANATTMNFIHVEVWKDFQRHQVNKAAAEWIYRTGSTDLHEPWVFVIDRQGKVTERFDNVATEQELDDAVRTATTLQ